MEQAERIWRILEAQRAQIRELEQALTGLESMDVIRQNDQLRASLREHASQLSLLEKKAATLDAENKRLKEALTDLMLSQKLSLTAYSKKMIELYYAGDEADSANRLIALEARCRERLRIVKAASEQNASALNAALHGNINAQEAAVQEAILEARRKEAAGRASLKGQTDSEYRRLSASPITDKHIERSLKTGGLEWKLGSRAANIAGVLLILLGVIFGLQYTYTHFLYSSELKGAAAFLLGALFLIAGEWCSRRERFRSVFSKGMSAGGVAILYASASLSYFNLRILTMAPALFVCILITAIAFFLSLRHSAAVVAVFALLGGYLPIFALSGDAFVLYGALFYFLILNLFTLALASWKKWPVFNLFSFSLQWLGVLYIYGRFSDLLPSAFRLLYLSGVFLMYMGVILIQPIRAKTKIITSDIVLLALNTAFNCTAIYVLLNAPAAFGYNGLLAVLFLTVYWAGGKLLNRFLPRDVRAATVFYLTAFTFAILIIPFQFGVRWLAMGWLVEGTAAAVFGILRKESWYERAGLSIAALCLCAFPSDIARGFSAPDLFFFKASCLTAGLIAILAAYHRVSAGNALFWATRKGGYVKGYQFALAVGAYVYAVYASLYLYDKFGGDSLFSAMLLSVSVTFLYAFALRRIRRLAAQTIEIFSLVLTASGAASLVLINLISTGRHFRDSLFSARLLLILSDLFAVCAAYEFGQRIANRFTRFSEWMTLAVSGFGLLLTVMVLTVQFRFGAESVILSAVLVAAAIGWILAGFMSRNKKLRVSGLALTLFATAKVFLLDLSFLRNELRILSYFLFGAALIGISFVYQIFTKKLGEKTDQN
ncbi:MAG: DUF2339 domain-containing protein [Clostridiales bacterium]|jgi:uncharacterized membrane protein|nr:DUF2339 domain-containing protein [Clostridiales bacterium]